MAGESNKKKTSTKLPKRNTKPTGTLAQKQKRKKAGRPSLTDMMKEYKSAWDIFT